MSQSKADKFLETLNSGNTEEIRKMLELEMELAKHHPDTATQLKGKPAVFKRKGKVVGLGTDGKWHPKETV